MESTIPALLREVTERIEARIHGVRALALVNLDGSITEQVTTAPDVDPEILSEYVTLLRIAHRTSEDLRTGELLESSWASDRSIILTRRVSSEVFLILIGEPDISAGLARYVLRQTAARLQPLETA